MANANIGHIKCPHTDQLCVVRRDCRGKLYYFSPAGKIAPNLPAGQEWMQKNTVLWPNGEQPENVEVKTHFNGAPPVVTVKTAAPQPVTDESVTPQSESKREDPKPSNNFWE